MDRLIAVVALRWRIELRMLARARERAVGLLLLLPGVALAGSVGFFIFYFGVRTLAAAAPELLLPLLSAAATGIGLFWALSPLLAGVAFSESHDVARLLHFPVRVPVLAAASLLSNLLQPMVLLKVPVLLGVALGVAERWALVPLAFAGVTVTFVFMLAASQAAGLLLHALSRNRRLHDAALVVGLGLGFALSVAPVIAIAAGGRVMDAVSRLVTRSDVFALSPFAWGVRAAVHGGRGELLAFLAYAGLGLAAAGATMAGSAVLIDRIHRGALDLGGAAGVPARSRIVLGGALGALLEKDMRAAWRDPALKATLLMGAVTPLVFLVLLTRGPARGGAPVMVLASIVGLSTFGANPFGFERRGIQLLMSFPVPRFKILLGKNLGAIALRAPGVAALVLANLLLGSPALLPAVLVVVLSTFLVSAGLDNYMAIWFPAAAPAPGHSPYGGGVAGGRGLGAAALGSALLLGALAASSPFAVLAWLPLAFGLPWLWVLTLPLALAGAAAVYAMLVAGAARLLERREPDLLQRILEEA